MNRLFRTKDAHLAALLRLELSREALTGIVFDETGTGWFEFDRHPQCIAIMKAFYADDADSDFASGYPVNDARALLREASAVRKELAIARDKRLELA
jgi:hypothetical protein